MPTSQNCIDDERKNIFRESLSKEQELDYLRTLAKLKSPEKMQTSINFNLPGNMYSIASNCDGCNTSNINGSIQCDSAREAR